MKYKYDFKKMTDSDKGFITAMILDDLWKIDKEAYYIYSDTWDAENVCENIYLNKGIESLIEFLKA